MVARDMLCREEASIWEALKGFLGVCGLVLVCLLASSGPVVAQADEPEAPEATPAADLINPAIPTEELTYLLVPLTKEELDPLARAWLEIVRSKTEEIADRKVELLRDPSAATDTAYQEIARMTEERAGLFERLTMVVDELENKGGDEALVTELRAYRDSVLLSETRLRKTA